MKLTKQLTLNELINLVFEQGQVAKQYKDKLFKLAKANDDMETIKRLWDELQFKGAKVYLNKYNKTYIDTAIRNKELKLLKKLIGNGADISHINLSELAGNEYPIEYFQILLKAGAKTHKEDYSGKTALIVAILQKNIELVNLLLEFGANANDHTFRFRTSRPHVIKSPILEGETALHLAASIGELSVVESLIIYGAKIDALDESKLTPLMIAIWNGHLDIVKILLENDADINISDVNGVTPIIRASCEGHKEIVEFLLKQGINVNQKDKGGRTALMDASYFKHNDIVGLLLKYGADPIKKGKDITPINNELDVDKSFMMACELKDKFLIQIHINRGANVNIQNPLGVTALMALVEDPNLIEILLKAGANPNLQTLERITALFIAARDGHLESLKMLIQYKADINISAKNGTTPLMMAIHNKHENIAKMLIDAGVDVNKKTIKGDTALLMIINQDKYALINLLSKNGARIDIKHESATKHFFFSAHYGYEYIVKQMIKDGMDINAQINGETVICAAIDGNKSSIIKILIENNVDLNIKDVHGWTPLMLAISLENDEIIKLLIEQGVDVNTVGIEGQTAIFFAIDKSNKKITQMLIDAGANINHQTLDKTFPLMIAIANKSTNILKLLLQHNAKTDLQDNDGYTALMVAAEHENTEALKLLIENGADTTLKMYDYDYDDEDEELDTGLGNTALNIAINKNDWETNDNIEAIKIILATRKVITSNEAASLDILLSNNEISKLASKILVAMDGWFMTTLMYTLMINGSIWQVQRWGIGFNSGGKENREKDADEYMKYNILLNCKSLIESGVDINYEGGGSTALKSAEEMGMIEVIELLESYLEKNTLKLNGLIRFNENKCIIDVDNREITFMNKVEKKFEKFEKDSEVKNRYINDNGYIEINNKTIIQGRSEKEVIEYKVDSISGNPIEVEDNHNPKRLVEILNLFTEENPIKYTAHSFEWSRYESYKNFMKEVKQEFAKVKNDLKVLSPELHTKINKFIFDDTLDENNTWGMSKMDFGWSSPELKDWCSIEDSKVNGKKAINFPLTKQYQKEIGDKTLVSFEDVCSVLKNEIEIRDDDKLKILFATIKKDVLKFNFEVVYKNLEAISFYTDVENFKSGLTLIFEQFKEDGREKYDTIEIEAIPNESENYVDIRIMQIGSTVEKKSDEMEKETENGHFQDIKNHFSSLCDWSIEASFGDGDFRVNYLSSDENSIKPISLKKKPLGFTHILRFYK